MSSSDLLAVDGVTLAWRGTPVISDVSFRLGEGEFVVLLGPNGSGKTTLLRCLAGLEPRARGRIVLSGRRIDELPAHRRGVGMLFQEPAVFAHRTVYENVAYGLELMRPRPASTDARVEEMLRLVHLTGFEDRLAGALSGGERQRVALARTLAPRPSLVLLDEPFASVDPALRAELLGEFRDVLRAQSTAAIHVTHDRDEGMFLGERVLLLMAGRLCQDGPSADVFRAPSNAAIARFLGYNVLDTDHGPVAVHPRHLRLDALGDGRPEATVVRAGSTGTEQVVYLRTSTGRSIEARLPEGGVPVRGGARVGLRWDQESPLPGDERSTD